MSSESLFCDIYNSKKRQKKKKLHHCLCIYLFFNWWTNYAFDNIRLIFKNVFYLYIIQVLGPNSDYMK